MSAAGSFRFLEGDSVKAAKRLLGCLLVRTVGGQQMIGRIVETEAYHQTDAASHSYKGRTPRTDVMFGSAGRLYVYFTYGMHYCMNVVTGAEGEGSAVLIRAIEPVEGQEIMAASRRGAPEHQLTNGPAKLCQALQVDIAVNGHNLQEAPLQLLVEPSLPDQAVVQTTRIGISKDKDRPWRFYINDSPFVSKR